jgi:hypothetical protein
MSRTTFSKTWILNVTTAGYSMIYLNETILVLQGSMIVWQSNNGATLESSTDVYTGGDYIWKNQTLIPLKSVGTNSSVRILIAAGIRSYGWASFQYLSQSFPYPGAYTVTMYVENYNVTSSCTIVVVDGIFILT